MSTELSHWKRLTTFVKENDQFTLHQIRWQLRDRDNNGLIQDGVVKMLGRTMYIHELRFPVWFDKRCDASKEHAA